MRTLHDRRIFRACRRLERLDRLRSYYGQMVTQHEHSELLTAGQRQALDDYRACLELWDREEQLLCQLDGSVWQDVRESPEWATVHSLESRISTLQVRAYLALVPPGEQPEMPDWLAKKAAERGWLT